MLAEALLDACSDMLVVLPFLVVTYVFMEWLEHGAGTRFAGAVARSGRLGPLLGALLGVIPQCGFSGAAATLYAGRVITLGTLVSVFLVTSDEMLPLFIAQAVPVATIAKVLGVKVAAGLVAGYATDAALARANRLHTGLSRRARHEGHGHNDIHELCEQERCACGADVHADAPDGHASAVRGGVRGIVLPACKHALSVALFVFVITFALDIAIEAGLQEALAGIGTSSLAGIVVFAFVGLVPNCAVSVGVTQLYLGGLLSGGALMATLCVNAGVGLLVLLRTNLDRMESVAIALLMCVFGMATGLVVYVCGVL